MGQQQAVERDAPLVEPVLQVYEKGVTVDAETLASCRIDWHPSEDLPKWAITIGSP